MKERQIGLLLSKVRNARFVLNISAHFEEYTFDEMLTLNI